MDPFHQEEAMGPLKPVWERKLTVLSSVAGPTSLRRVTTRPTVGLQSLLLSTGGTWGRVQPSLRGWGTYQPRNQVVGRSPLTWTAPCRTWPPAWARHQRSTRSTCWWQATTDFPTTQTGAIWSGISAMPTSSLSLSWHVPSSIVSPSGRETIWRSGWSCFEAIWPSSPRSETWSELNRNKFDPTHRSEHIRSVLVLVKEHMSERDSSEFETSEFVQTEKRVNGKLKSGFWRGCHLWTNPGAGFQTDPVSASKQIQISGTFCVLLYDVAAAKKLSQKIWALESNFKLNFNFNQCQDWEVGHCQWNKLRCKSVAEFSIKQIFYSFTVCQTEIGFILVTQHIEMKRTV